MDRFLKPAAVFLCFTAFAVILVGCGASSPRFGSTPKREKEAATKATPPKSTPREKTTATPEKESSKGEKGEVKRDFKKEKNTAISALDQSKLMRHISKYMGVPYKLGGESLDGMDCSGYTMTVYRDALGIQLPRTSFEQSKLGTVVDFEELKFGDLIFFNTTGEEASHVGIYLGDDLFAHSGVTLGVTISSLQSSYFRERYEGARRIVE